ncbi:hypothetical protein C8F01DRAFT_327088 [Mycena amicta]|nr:hypothetical protein C8F01DRAFT_327088 [Mycena amicta]
MSLDATFFKISAHGPRLLLAYARLGHEPHQSRSHVVNSIFRAISSSLCVDASKIKWCRLPPLSRPLLRSNTAARVLGAWIHKESKASSAGSSPRYKYSCHKSKHDGFYAQPIRGGTGTCKLVVNARPSTHTAPALHALQTVPYLSALLLSAFTRSLRHSASVILVSIRRSASLTKPSTMTLERTWMATQMRMEMQVTVTVRVRRMWMWKRKAEMGKRRCTQLMSSGYGGV